MRKNNSDLAHNELITDRSGKPHQYFHCTAWGESFAQAEATQGSFSSSYRFNAKELDQETGNYYYGARYYHMKWSVWLSMDPLASKYPSMSPYVFTGNNPIMLVDPDGRAPSKTRIPGPFSTESGFVQKSTTGVSAHRLTPNARRTLEVGRDMIYMTTVGWFFEIANILMESYAGNKESLDLSKDVAANTTEKILENYGTERGKSLAKNGGGALGLFSIYGSATKPDSRQEILEDFTFKVMKAAYNADDVISQQGQAINFAGKNYKPEDVANLLNAAYNVLDTSLKPEEFDLSTSQGQQGAFRYLQENLSTIVEQIDQVYEGS